MFKGSTASLTFCTRLWRWDCHRAKEQCRGSSGDPPQLSGRLCVEVHFLWQVFTGKVRQCSILWYVCARPETQLYVSVNLIFSWKMYSFISEGQSVIWVKFELYTSRYSSFKLRGYRSISCLSLFNSLCIFWALKNFLHFTTVCERCV